MISIDGREVVVEHFPDGTQCLTNFNFNPDFNGVLNIYWKYSCEEELVTLMYAMNHIRDGYLNRSITVNLYMPYVPNARMDRTKKNTEIFTLKHFCKFINYLEFDKVYVLDVHSDVAVALLDRCKLLNVNDIIKKAIEKENKIAEKDDKELVIYFPDAGAYKRYRDLDCIKKFKKIYGNKVRDWSTGKILGLDIVDENSKSLKNTAVMPLAFNNILIVDDIISYGGTMYYSAIQLNEFKANRIAAYATHVETDSLWNEEKGTFKKCLEDNTVSMLYTTNSIYRNKSGNNVTVFNIEKSK